MLRSPLVHFLLAGALLHVVLFAANARETPRPVAVLSRADLAQRVEELGATLRREPTEAERRALEGQLIEEALWIAEAFRLRLDRLDPVVERRLLRNMEFLGESDGETPAGRLARARALGLDRSDPVVRRRLVDRVQARVRDRVRANPPDRATLDAYLETERDRFREPERVDLEHVFFSRDRRGPRAAHDAARARTRIEAEGLTPESARALGDPFLSGHGLRGASPRRLEARFGPEFAARLRGADAARWHGPIESAFGSHLVWVSARTPSRVPEFERIETQLREAWFAAEIRRALRAAVDELRERIEVRIDGAPSPSEGSAG